MDKKKKSKIKRNNAEYPAFKSSLNLKIRLEELTDIDYIDKLSNEEKAWLNNFNEEWVNANLNHKGKKFHKSKKNRKIIFDRNNARNRDGFIKAKMNGQLDYFADNKDKLIVGNENLENRMILEYDLKYNYPKKK